MSFAEIKQRANAAILARFAVEATINAAPVNGIFDNDYADAFDVMAGSQPSFLCASADVASIARGAAVIIGGIAYTVQKPPQADGAGFTRLILQKT